MEVKVISFRKGCTIKDVERQWGKSGNKKDTE